MRKTPGSSDAVMPLKTDDYIRFSYAASLDAIRRAGQVGYIIALDWPQKHIMSLHGSLTLVSGSAGVTYGRANDSGIIKY